MSGRCMDVCGASVCQCQDAIDVISDLYPPDSDFPECAAEGRRDLIEALCAEWRSQPLAVLERMAHRQRQRDAR